MLRMGDVQREWTVAVVSQMGGWTTCEQKGTVAVVSLLGDVRTRRGRAWCNSNRRVGDVRKREGTVGSWMDDVRTKGDGGVTDG